MDRGAQLNLQEKVRYNSDLALYLLHYIYSIKELEVGDESEYWWDVKSILQHFNSIRYSIWFTIYPNSFQFLPNMCKSLYMCSIESARTIYSAHVIVFYDLSLIIRYKYIFVYVD